MVTKTEDFIYKHIPKLGYLVNILVTLFFAWGFSEFPSDSFIFFVIRLYVFGFVWWFVFALCDKYTVKYRTKILIRTPELKDTIIRNKINEIEEITH